MKDALARSAFLTVLLCVFYASAAASDMENAIVFKNLSYPMEISLSGGENPGAALFETDFSVPPSNNYDTVLLQGEMPDPGISLELIVKSASIFGNSVRYKQVGFRRFPGGRFWAKYSIGAPTQAPLKISVVNINVKGNCVLTIYAAELLKESALKEEREIQAAVPYAPDSAFYLPPNVPFKVIRRSEWQAAPPNQPYIPHAPQYFTLHHTQARYPKTYKESVAEIQFIQDYHQNARGWIDIGYHFLIDPFGNIFEGRPINVVGAHAKNHNTGNVGISVMGSYHPPASNPITEDTINSLVVVGRYLKDAYSVNVSGFYSHREIGATDCPGDGLYAKKEMLRDLIFDPQPVLPPVDLESLRQLMKSDLGLVKE